MCYIACTGRRAEQRPSALCMALRISRALTVRPVGRSTSRSSCAARPTCAFKAIGDARRSGVRTARQQRSGTKTAFRERMGRQSSNPTSSRSDVRQCERAVIPRTYFPTARKSEWHRVLLLTMTGPFANGVEGKQRRGLSRTAAFGPSGPSTVRQSVFTGEARLV